VGFFPHFFSVALDEKPTLDASLMKHLILDAISNTKADRKRA
jgi:hypothetical protein